MHTHHMHTHHMHTHTPHMNITCTHTHMHTNIHTHAHKHTHTCTYAHKHTHICVHAHTHTHTHTHTRWTCDCWLCHIRHDAMHEATSEHLVCGPGLQHGSLPPGRWDQRDEALSASCQGHDPPAPWLCWGMGVWCACCEDVVCLL